MARFQYTRYRSSTLATVLSYLGGFLGLTAVGFGIGCFRAGYWQFALVFLIGGILFFFVLQKIADKIGEKAYQKLLSQVEENRKGLMYQHIIPTRFWSGDLYIKCPKCGNEVAISKVCSCGSKIWKQDILFDLEIAEIYRKNGINY